MGWKDTARTAEKKVFGSGGFKRRYGIGKGKGGFKFAKLASDLEMVKNRLNVEKKYVDVDVTTDIVGQVEGSVDGSIYRDITPLIAQGVSRTQRNGNSLKMTGLTMPIQFQGQVQCLNDRHIRVSLLKVRSADNGVSAQEAFEQVWDINPLTGLRDYNAPRAYRNSKTDGISVIRSKSFTLRGPKLDSGALGADQQELALLNTRLSFKLQDVLRYASDASTVPEGFKYILVIQMDAGNASGSVTGTLDVPVNTVSSGCVARIATRWWYVDN